MAQAGVSQGAFELAAPMPGDTGRAKQKDTGILAKGFDSASGAGQHAHAINDFVATVFRIYGNAPRTHGSLAAPGRANFCSSCGTTAIKTWPTTAKLPGLSLSSVSCGVCQYGISRSMMSTEATPRRTKGMWSSSTAVALETKISPYPSREAVDQTRAVSQEGQFVSRMMRRSPLPILATHSTALGRDGS